MFLFFKEIFWLFYIIEFDKKELLEFFLKKIII